MNEPLTYEIYLFEKYSHMNVFKFIIQKVQVFHSCNIKLSNKICMLYPYHVFLSGALHDLEKETSRDIKKCS